MIASRQPSLSLAVLCAALSAAPALEAETGATPGPSCFELLPKAYLRPVNLVVVAPLDHICEGCLSEVDELATTPPERAGAALRTFVVFVPLGGEPEEILRRRVQLLPPGTVGVIDEDHVCLAAGSPLVESGLGPWKLVLTRDLTMVAMDFCSESELERVAFRRLLTKAIRKLAPPARPEPVKP